MKRVNVLMILSISSLISYNVAASATNLQKSDSICTHRIVRDANGKILSWYKPEINGAGYDHVIKLASEFIKNVLPSDPKTGLKLYYLYSEINGPESGMSSYVGIGSSNRESGC